MPRPPMTTTHPSPAMASVRSFLESLPVVEPSVGMAFRRLRRLGLDPAHAARAGVEEAMGGADAREDDVAGADRVHRAVELRGDLAVEEEVRLLERVVVDLRRSARLVIDGEHGEQLGAEDAVDEHLHTDAAVDDERRVA